MKLNSSPSGTPSRRKRIAISELSLSFITNPARIPETLAGDKRKSLPASDLEGDLLSALPLT
jgi:hypothetical protein